MGAEDSVSLTRAAIAAGGADASLQVTPYYNKPNAEGIYRHFATVADLGLPIVLYNVPGRSGREIPLDVVERLARHPNVVAIKEAAGSVERVSAIKARCPDFTVLSGDDSLVLPMVSVGASGVISVASNVIPKEMGDFVRTALAGDMAAARALHLKYYPLFHDLFIDTNPIMVKEALVMMKKIGPGFRLPLCETTPLLDIRRHGGVEREVHHGLGFLRPRRVVAIRDVDLRDDREGRVGSGQFHEHLPHAPCGAQNRDLHACCPFVPAVTLHSPATNTPQNVAAGLL